MKRKYVNYYIYHQTNEFRVAALKRTELLQTKQEWDLNSVFFGTSRVSMVQTETGSVQNLSAVTS